MASSRFRYSHAPTGKDYGVRKKALREIRHLERECQERYWSDAKGAQIFLYGLEYLFWEQDAKSSKSALLVRPSICSKRIGFKPVLNATSPKICRN